MSEVRSVFSVPMQDDPQFPFTFLQRCGPGSNALTAPSLSTSFTWTAREVVKLAGQGCLYIKAESEMYFVKSEPHEVSQCLRYIHVPFTLVVCKNAGGR